jgi:beta-glucuronidase
MGFSDARPIAVPASWNEQFEDGRDQLGPAWYQVRFDQPRGFDDQAAYLRFGSVNYLADAWLNGVHLGQHEGGHLPFEFDVTRQLEPENNLLVVRVDGRLAPDRVPPGNIPADPLDTFANVSNPNTSFDFFPYCGIHRPVFSTAPPLLPLPIYRL